MAVELQPDLEAQRTSCEGEKARPIANEEAVSSQDEPGYDSDAARSVKRPNIRRRRGSRSSSQATAEAQSPIGAATSLRSSSETSSEEDVEEAGLFEFAEAVGWERPPGEPWFMEMTRLRRYHFVYLNKKLAASRKRILEQKTASDHDMEELTKLFHDQGIASLFITATCINL